MDLGARQIRTAGKGSGSIEVTLPTELRDLVGLPCRITLRDGSRPDIVLQPDLRRAQAAFAALWRANAAALLREPPPLPLADFGFALQPGAGGDQPLLCWRDGLALCRPPPHQQIAVSRTLAAFGHVLAASCRITPALAAGFGAACGYLAAGLPPSADWREACDLAAAGLANARPGAPLEAARAAAEGAEGPAFWTVAGPLLTAAADLFLGWTADPASHAALRAAWRRGLSIELSGG